jgi:hypothetical protein
MINEEKNGYKSATISYEEQKSAEEAIEALDREKIGKG